MEQQNTITDLREVILSDSQLSISDIAELLSLSDPRFIKRYKEIKGLNKRTT